MMAKKVLKWVALAVCALGCVRIALLYGMRGFLLYGALASAFAIYLELARQEETDSLWNPCRRSLRRRRPKMKIEQVENKEEKLAACPYCGEQQYLTVDAEVSLEELSCIAAEKCRCEQAIAFRRRKSDEAAMQEICGGESIYLGFGNAVEAGVVQALNELMRKILDGAIKKATITTSRGETIKISCRSDDIEIVRSSKYCRATYFTD